MKDNNIYFRFYGKEGNLKEVVGGADDALGELREEEIVWGEMETQEVKDGAGGGGTDKRAVNSRNNHGAAGRRHSMLSKQIETQASTWAAGDRMVAAAAAEEANKESCVVQEYNGEIVGEAGSGDGVNGPYRHVGKLIPPHELLARQYSSSASFSVLHGAGRTLKGMDLKRLRNEVWRQTGFVD